MTWHSVGFESPLQIAFKHSGGSLADGSGCGEGALGAYNNGNGNGDGNGYGFGDGFGNGFGYGNGYGYCDGYGDGNNYGDGDGDSSK